MERTPRLKCSTCGQSPTPDQARWCAKPGGTHFREITHSVGTGRTERKQLRTCGTWVAVEPEAQP